MNKTILTAASGVGQSHRRRPAIGVLGTYPPTICGHATFSAALADGLSANEADVRVVRVSDGSATSDARVVGELINGSPSSVAAGWELLNQNDIALIHHEDDLYGAGDGDDVLDILAGLRIPSIVVAHTVLTHPSARQRSMLQQIAALAGQVVVSSRGASERLHLDYGVDRAKITTIAHGATICRRTTARRMARPTLVTWGLLRPGKGVERVIDAMVSLRDLPGNPRYLIVGQTHPKFRDLHGETYREALVEQVRSSGVAGSVTFDASYKTSAALNELAQTSTAVVLPYDSADQLTSGVLVDAIACGRPVIATAFPHAVELLGGGAGIVVDPDDPEALPRALHRVVTDPYLAGSMAAEARRLAPTMGWPVVAREYLALAQRLIAQRSLFV